MARISKTAKRMAWATALLSGKYRQGRGMLRTPGGRYCCLGVAKQACGAPNSDWDDIGELSEKDRDSFGLDHGTQSALINYNDDKGKKHRTFTQIGVAIKQAGRYPSRIVPILEAMGGVAASKGR